MDMLVMEKHRGAKKINAVPAVLAIISIIVADSDKRQHESYPDHRNI